MKAKRPFAMLAGIAVSTLFAANVGWAQRVHEISPSDLTKDNLVNVLTPKESPTRGISLEPPKCTHFHEAAARGIELEPKADIAAISVEFETNSAKLTPAAEKTLGVLGQALDSAELKPCCFEIQGFTDSTGRLALNQQLSQARARSVTDYLAHHGIDDDRMMPKGFGPAQPVASNATRQGRAKNRRVQVVNLGYGDSTE